MLAIAHNELRYTKNVIERNLTNVLKAIKPKDSLGACFPI